MSSTELKSLGLEEDVMAGMSSSSPGSLLLKNPDQGIWWKALGSFYFVSALMWVAISIIYTYFIDGITDTKTKWNVMLPDLGQTPAKAALMGMHFIAGIYLTLCGIFQVLPYSRLPEKLHLHRINGRIFVFCSLIAFIGGEGFMILQGRCAGGWSMTISFVIYGLLVLVFTVMAYITARNKDIEAHRRWAIRALAMGMGSWGYRGFLSLGQVFKLVPPYIDPPLNEETREDPNFNNFWYHFAEWAFWIVTWAWVEWYLNAAATNAAKIGLKVSIVVFAVLITAFLVYYGLTYAGVQI